MLLGYLLYSTGILVIFKYSEDNFLILLIPQYDSRISNIKKNYKKYFKVCITNNIRGLFKELY